MTAIGHWLNGDADGAVDPQARALHYGDGVFETLRISASTPEFLDRHLHRLRAGCERLALDQPDWDALRSEIIGHAAGVDGGVLKVILSRGSGERGYGFRTGQGVTRQISLYPSPQPATQNQDRGIRVHVCDMRLATQPRLAGIKHLNRLEQVMARAQWPEDSQEGLMLDYQGNLVEGTMSNVFVIRNDTLFTPPLDQCGVAGVMRSVILDLAADRAVQTVLEPLRIDAFDGTESLFVCNSLIGIWPVAAIAGKGAFKIDSLTRKLQQALTSLDKRHNGNWYST